jgi:hypothetical protein
LITVRATEAAGVAGTGVGELRVLGAAPVAAPAGGFDPGAALVATPPQATTSALIGTSALARTPTSGTASGSTAVGSTALGGTALGGTVTPRRATPPRMRPAEPAPAAAGPRQDPETRWRAAVAARPLESPRAFPAAMRPLLTALTGAERASYTTGPATRQALSAAGAHGATTGSVVHLPAAPSPAPGPLFGVVAHELAHARNPVTRPRFLLEIPDGSADADERTALSVGRRFQSMAAGGGDTIRAGIVEELPVGGLGRVGGIAGQARAALTGGGPLGGAAFSGGALGGALGDAAGGALSGGALSGAAALGSGALSGALSGAGALAEDTLEGELPDVGMPQLPGTGGAPNWPGAGMPGADLTGAGGGVAGAASAAMGAITSVTGAGSAPGGANPPSNVDIDRLADLLEQRLLKQIERRGGRYAGVF